MTRMYWVEDFLSGAVLDNRHYQTREAAAARRNELGYGVVKWFDFQDGGSFTVEGGCPMGAKCNGCG